MGAAAAANPDSGLAAGAKAEEAGSALHGGGALTAQQPCQCGPSSLHARLEAVKARCHELINLPAADACHDQQFPKLALDRFDEELTELVHSWSCWPEVLPTVKERFLKLLQRPDDAHEEPVAEDHDDRDDRAFVALLHGKSESFYIYALLVGTRLKRLSPAVDRVLLCAGSWVEDRVTRTALEQVWKLQDVELVDAPHATSAHRHRYVFSKVKMFGLPYKHLIFLDLDLVPREDMSPLFDLPAPAGMLHGDCPRGELKHGCLIPVKDEDDEREAWWCPNAGVMRLDTLPSARQRREQLERTIAEVKAINVKSMLPEQYFLARHLKGWRQIAPCWNMEVDKMYSDPGWSWPKHSAGEHSRAKRGRLWMDQDIAEVKVFHFSGTNLMPEWFAHLSPEDAFAFASARWNHRDPRRLIAHAAREWTTAFQEMLQECDQWPGASRKLVKDIAAGFQWEAFQFFCGSSPSRLSEGEGEGIACEGCGERFRDESRDGRHQLWENIWLCQDCIIGHINKDDLADAPYCDKCGALCDEGYWDYERECAGWRCTTCEDTGDVASPPPPGE